VRSVPFLNVRNVGARDIKIAVLVPIGSLTKVRADSRESPLPCVLFEAQEVPPRNSSRIYPLPFKQLAVGSIGEA
jgi:hypothetical protein